MHHLNYTTLVYTTLAVIGTLVIAVIAGKLKDELYVVWWPEITTVVTSILVMVIWRIGTPDTRLNIFVAATIVVGILVLVTRSVWIFRQNEEHVTITLAYGGVALYEVVLVCEIISHHVGFVSTVLVAILFGAATLCVAIGTILEMLNSRDLQSNL